MTDQNMAVLLALLAMGLAKARIRPDEDLNTPDAASKGEAHFVIEFAASLAPDERHGTGTSQERTS